MSKANEPAYPMCNELGHLHAEGLSKREKLAMEIYARTILCDSFIKSFITGTDSSVSNEVFLEIAAKSSIRAADIFFEQLK